MFCHQDGGSDNFKVCCGSAPFKYNSDGTTATTYSSFIIGGACVFGFLSLAGGGLFYNRSLKNATKASSKEKEDAVKMMAALGMYDNEVGVAPEHLVKDDGDHHSHHDPLSSLSSLYLDESPRAVLEKAMMGRVLEKNEDSDKETVATVSDSA
jgi:hypothetical protein